MFEAEVGFVAEAVGGGVFAGHDDVWRDFSLRDRTKEKELTFDADAEIAIFVVAGFYGDMVSGDG